jgi:hypothetical protein
VSASQSGTWQQEITDGTNVLGTPANPLRTDPTGTTTQPVSGTVHVATSAPITGGTNCNVADGNFLCISSDLGLSSGNVINTVSVFCDLALGHHLTISFLPFGSQIIIPLTYTATIGGVDEYGATLSNLGVVLQSNPSADFQVTQDYSASGGNGATCSFSVFGTSS